MNIEVRDGIVRASGARLIDRMGRKMLPIGNDGFETAVASSVHVDKTMLVADVLESGYKVTLFCRPRRFGKTLNMTMLKAFFEDAPNGASRPPLFEGTEVWEAEGGRYRERQGTYPVVHLSFRTAKGDTWVQTYEAIKELVIAEVKRHAYLVRSDALLDEDRERLSRLMSGGASEGGGSSPSSRAGSRAS